MIFDIFAALVLFTVFMAIVRGIFYMAFCSETGQVILLSILMIVVWLIALGVTSGIGSDYFWVVLSIPAVIVGGLIFERLKARQPLVKRPNSQQAPDKTTAVTNRH